MDASSLVCLLNDLEDRDLSPAAATVRTGAAASSS